jgi:hypothetical protein
MDGFEKALRDSKKEHERMQQLQQRELVRLVAGDAWGIVGVDEADVQRLFQQIKARAEKILLLDVMLVSGERLNGQETYKKKAPAPSTPVTREKGPAW